MMKKITFLVFALLSITFVFGQTPDTSYWNIGGVTSLTFSQTQFKYWSAGGNNSVACRSERQMIKLILPQNLVIKL